MLMKQLKLVEKYLNLKDLLASTIFMVGILSLNIFVNPGTLAYVGSIVLLAIPLAFLGLAETLVLITGEVDMSVGAGMALANVFASLLWGYTGVNMGRCLPGPAVV
jgi:ribose/xylose/arabinose/galactoside ABC-type transport system permease subunit